MWHLKIEGWSKIVTHIATLLASESHASTTKNSTCVNVHVFYYDKKLCNTLKKQPPDYWKVVVSTFDSASLWGRWCKQLTSFEERLLAKFANEVFSTLPRWIRSMSFSFTLFSLRFCLYGTRTRIQVWRTLSSANFHDKVAQIKFECIHVHKHKFLLLQYKVRHYKKHKKCGNNCCFLKLLFFKNILWVLIILWVIIGMQTTISNPSHWCHLTIEKVLV